LSDLSTLLATEAHRCPDPQLRADYDAVGLTPLWRRAEEVMATVSSLTVLGYRLPITDEAAVHLLLQAAGRMNAGTPVRYVTLGDEDAVRRFRPMFPTPTSIAMDSTRSRSALPRQRRGET